MNSLERFQAAMRRAPVDRLPWNANMVPELAQKLIQHFDLADSEALLYNFLGIDRRRLLPRYTGPEPARYADGTFDNLFGVRMRNVSYGRGVYQEAVGFPLANAQDVAEVERYAWPNAADYDYAAMPAALSEHPDSPFMVGYLSLGWTAWDMRGFDQFLSDLLCEPEIAGAIIQHVSDFGYESFRRQLESCRAYCGKAFSCIQLADDWATQEGLLISPSLFRRFFKPHYRRIIDMAHAYGVWVEFHCCGSAVELIPDIIDMGADILNPIQTSARGMDPALLKREFGRDIVFSGGLDVQTVMPFGTAEQVKETVYYLLDTLGAGGGYILEPSHSLQIDTPIENVMAMKSAYEQYYGL